MRIPTLQRYLTRQIWAAITFVLVGFLALFAFFDLIAELRDLGKGNYALQQIITVVGLGLPAHAYELMPVAPLRREASAIRSRAARFITIVLPPAIDCTIAFRNEGGSANSGDRPTGLPSMSTVRVRPP